MFVVLKECADVDVGPKGLLDAEVINLFDSTSLWRDWDILFKVSTIRSIVSKLLTILILDDLQQLLVLALCKNDSVALAA